MLERNKIYLGDCLELMREIEDGSVDCVITDPPYGIGADSKMYKTKNQKYGNAASYKKDYGDSNWDIKTGIEYIKELIRISKNQIIFGGNYYADWLPPSRCWIVWNKENGDNHFADCELAWTSFDEPVRLFTYMWNGMLQGNMGRDKEIRQHPTQKPLPLMRWIIENYTNEGDLILDPFAGSGTTLVACKELGRDYIGMEKEEKYIPIIQNRLDGVNLDLFIKIK